MLFVECLRMWLKTKRNKIETFSYNGYDLRIENWINRYFSAINARLYILEPGDFEDSYNTMYEEGV